MTRAEHLALIERDRLALLHKMETELATDHPAAIEWRRPHVLFTADHIHAKREGVERGAELHRARVAQVAEYNRYVTEQARIRRQKRTAA